MQESGFSSVVAINSESRNRLNEKDYMRIALSITIPQFDAFIKDKQEHRNFFSLLLLYHSYT